MRFPELKDIEAASRLIRPFIHCTPVLSSSAINQLMGCQLFFKCENFQKAGAFKFRGATNAVLNLSQEQAIQGVATHSSGNHAAALALAARNNGIKSYIVMPETAPDIKKKAVAGYGAEIIFCKPTLASRESTLETVVNETGAVFIHPYDNFRVISGQGTAALELLENVAGLDIVMAPVGGGGLMSGTSIAVKNLNSNIKVFAAEPAMADDAYRSFNSGRLFPSVDPQTIADGLLTSLSEMTFGIIRNYVDDILTASEESIIKAMQLIWERMKIIIEPSSAVPLAVIMENRNRFEGKKTGIILSGGNVELSRLPF